MKIYNKIVIDLTTGKTIFEDSFEYEGEIAHCGGGGGGFNETVDYWYNDRMATIAEKQSENADELFNLYKYGTFTAPDQGHILDNLEQRKESDGRTMYKKPGTDTWMTYDDAKAFVRQNPQYQTEAAKAAEIQGTGPNGQVTLQDILNQNPSMANLELAQIAGNMELVAPQTELAKSQVAAEQELLPGQTALTKAQNDAALQLLPGQTELTQAQNEALMTLLGPQTDLTLAQIDAAKKVLGPQADLMVAQAKAAQELLPGQTALSKAQTAAKTELLPQQTETQKAYLTAANKDINTTDMMNAAAADVNQQYGDLASYMTRELGRRGVAPGSGASASAIENLALEKAKAAAAARTTARRTADDLKFARLSDAAKTIQ